jgi:hypothetical protein
MKVTKTERFNGVTLILPKTTKVPYIELKESPAPNSNALHNGGLKSS